MKSSATAVRRHTEQVRLDPAGRIVLPARFRKSLNLAPGDPVTVTLDRDTLRISSARAALSRAQAIMKKRNPRKVSIVASLLAERRAEVAKED